MPGFEAFELLRPTDERDVVLVYTRWRSQEDFDAWLNSQAFQHGHKAHSTQGPVGTGSELWSFDVLQEERVKVSRAVTDRSVSSSRVPAGRSRSSSRTSSASRRRSTSSA